jgi:membrane protein
VTDYVTLLVTTPILVVVATTFAAAAESSSVVVFLRQTLQLGVVIDALLRFTSTVVVGAALFALFTILPNVHVRPTSALLGAGASALLWQGLLIVHVQFQVGVASYNALYSVLGSVPIFLVWTYFSWVIVLTGAQVAASHQNDLAPGRVLARRTDQALREELAVLLAAHVTRDFLAGGVAPSAPALATRLRIPRGTAVDLLEALVSARLLARAATGHDPGYLPGRDPGAIRLAAVRDALRRDPSADGSRAEIAARMAPPLRAALEAAGAEAQASAVNLTLRELAALLPLEPPARTAAPPEPSGPPPGPTASPSQGANPFRETAGKTAQPPPPPR